jgi:hypothetical protein
MSNGFNWYFVCRTPATLSSQLFSAPLFEDSTAERSDAEGRLLSSLRRAGRVAQSAVQRVESAVSGRDFPHALADTRGEDHTSAVVLAGARSSVISQSMMPLASSF